MSAGTYAYTSTVSVFCDRIVERPNYFNPEVQPHQTSGKVKNRTHREEVNTSKMDLLASYDDDGDKSQSSSTNKQDQVRFCHSVNGILYTSTSYLIIKNLLRL